MDDIVLARTLRSQGYDERDLARMRRDGNLIPVRRGAYVRERPAERTCAEAHRELILATVPQLHDGAVISHASAAVLHRLPTWPEAIDRVHLTRNRSCAAIDAPSCRSTPRRCLMITLRRSMACR